MAGTFNRRTGSPASSVAHRMGSAEFLLPDGMIVPESGLPPLTMRSAMRRRGGEGLQARGPGIKREAPIGGWTPFNAIRSEAVGKA